LIKKLVRSVTSHPDLKLAEMFRMFGMLGIDQQRNLMGPKGALDLAAIN
jgi:hypothetical protein